ncbi:hypothetical protein FVE85_4233 [Porphyridium purpureum]|uniref:Uncharacterized protein n=1 Tax=Porphyridium purpureum TaxID=35688 RepID=A0A5J4YSK5_PORPP|nr:hypothetical protein FVE85_4233 [Porphyridium purpureum]|eukprot:POR0188..scf229_5
MSGAPFGGTSGGTAGAAGDRGSTAALEEQLARLRAVLNIPANTDGNPAGPASAPPALRTAGSVGAETEMRRVMAACGVEESRFALMRVQDGLGRLLIHVKDEMELEKEIGALQKDCARLDFECALMDAKLMRLKGNIAFIEAGWMDQEQEQEQEQERTNI